MCDLVGSASFLLAHADHEEPLTTTPRNKKGDVTKRGIGEENEKAVGNFVRKFIGSAEKALVLSPPMASPV